MHTTTRIETLHFRTQTIKSDGDLDEKNSMTTQIFYSLYNYTNMWRAKWENKK